MDLEYIRDMLQLWLLGGDMAEQKLGADFPDYGKDARKLERLALNLINQALDIYKKHRTDNVTDPE